MGDPQGFFALMADGLVFIHFLFILGVILPVPLILIGGNRGWSWSRNIWFRCAHLLMIGTVIMESILGAQCPFTVWENDYRHMAGQDVENPHLSFVAYWLDKIIFYDFTPMTFTVIYLSFGLVVVFLYIFYPPERGPLF